MSPESAKKGEGSLPTSIPLESATQVSWEMMTGEIIDRSTRAPSTTHMLRSTVGLGDASISVVFPANVAQAIATRLLHIKSAAPDFDRMTLDFVAEMANMVAGVVGMHLANSGVSVSIGIPTASIFSGKQSLSTIRQQYRFSSRRFGTFWVSLED